MADAELVKTLDYILNRCGAAEIEAVAAAVVRRKRDLSMFGDAGVMDPARWAKKAAEDLAGSAGASLKAVRSTVRGLAAEMLRKEAPELDDDQIAELLGAWVPDPASDGGRVSGGAAGQSAGIVDVDGEAPSDRPSRIPPDVLLAMAEQFVAYSSGAMAKAEESALRRELGDWPERYWRSFPGGVRAVVTEYLKGTSDQQSFLAKLRAAVELAS